MNEHRKSDKPIVTTKPANKAAQAAAESVERRGLAKGNPSKQTTSRAQYRKSVHPALERVRQAARRDRTLRFTTLMHHIYNPDMLRYAFLCLKKDAAPGVDGETWWHYRQHLVESTEELSRRLKGGGYRAKAVRRTYIPKDDGRPRPLGVTALEDKIVQRATVEVLNAIYEVDFLDFSYGFRPGRGQHDCLDALYVAQLTRKVNWVLDADICGFFDTISHEWLVKCIEHRIADQRVLRLIKKWLNAGVLEDGRMQYHQEGTPQGGSASPFLANVYLHYVLDLWAQSWRQTKAWGDVIIVRWADDVVVGFQSKVDADTFRRELAERLKKFSLQLHPEKTKVIEFGPYAKRNAKKRGRKKPETFDFLGFTHICGTKRSNGMFTVIRKTRTEKMRAKLKAVKAELGKRMHQPIPEQGRWLNRVVEGHNQYYGVPMNLSSLNSFRHQVIRYWHWALNRRSQKSKLNWERMWRLVNHWLPPSLIHHPYPLRRLGVIT